MSGTQWPPEDDSEKIVLGQSGSVGRLRTFVLAAGNEVRLSKVVAATEPDGVTFIGPSSDDAIQNLRLSSNMGKLSMDNDGCVKFTAPEALEDGRSKPIFYLSNLLDAEAEVVLSNGAIIFFGGASMTTQTPSSIPLRIDIVEGQPPAQWEVDLGRPRVQADWRTFDEPTSKLLEEHFQEKVQTGEIALPRTASRSASYVVRRGGQDGFTQVRADNHTLQRNVRRRLIGAGD